MSTGIRSPRSPRRLAGRRPAPTHNAGTSSSSMTLRPDRPSLMSSCASPSAWSITPRDFRRSRKPISATPLPFSSCWEIRASRPASRKARHRSGSRNTLTTMSASSLHRLVRYLECPARGRGLRSDIGMAVGRRRRHDQHGAGGRSWIPADLVAIGTVPIGYPEKDVSRRYRRPSITSFTGTGLTRSS